MMDRRDWFGYFGNIFPKGTEINKERMELRFFLNEGDSYITILPFKYDVCHTCSGKGTHVHPSIDSHGITMNEWEQDWSSDEREDYINGAYDVKCYECQGERVVPVIDSESLTPDQEEDYDEWINYLDEKRESRRERESELRYGY